MHGHCGCDAVHAHATAPTQLPDLLHDARRCLPCLMQLRHRRASHRRKASPSPHQARQLPARQPQHPPPLLPQLRRLPTPCQSCMKQQPATICAALRACTTFHSSTQPPSTCLIRSWGSGHCFSSCSSRQRTSMHCNSKSRQQRGQRQQQLHLQQQQRGMQGLVLHLHRWILSAAGVRQEGSAGLTALCHLSLLLWARRG